ncbi:hypothetical protein HZC09_02445, partial [Candidatus Micrarchaeota archaeon]|nr:hypothetical protein [Candidatus Micrarchaeota archaeon]
MDILIYFAVVRLFMQLRTKDIRERIRDIEDFLLDEYKKNHPEKQRDWRTYEQRLAARLKYAIRNLEPLIDEAVSTLHVERSAGRVPELSLKQKVILILTKELFDKSNRNMEAMLDLFCLLTDVEISYKGVERLYSDPEVEMALHNLHVLILKRRGVQSVDASGDGTGYSLQISQHYSSEVKKREDEVKEADADTKKAFVYSFKLLDLNTKLYVAFGLSFKSEKQAYERAMAMFSALGLTLSSMRLDKYYSNPSDVGKLGSKVKVFVLPKKNATVKGSWAWKRRMAEFVLNTPAYLEEYYRRENSESQIGADKRWFGWGCGTKIRFPLATTNYATSQCNKPQYQYGRPGVEQPSNQPCSCLHQS